MKNENTVNSDEHFFDVVISGGGLSGTLMALSLVDLTKADGSALTIAIIEASPVLKNASLTYDDRVLALSHGTACYLEEVGAWPFLSAVAEPIKQIHVSDRGHYGKARLDASEHKVSALGYVVEMTLIGQTLQRALEGKSTLANKNVQWFTPDSITDVQWQKKEVNIHLSSGVSLSTKLLLGCDGAQSACRQFANINVDKSEYGQCALITNITTEKPHNNIAFERFTETGPIAMLPLSRGRCSLVWTLTPDLAAQMRDLDDVTFKQQLERSFGSWLGAITDVGKRVIYPLNLVQAQEQVYHRMALIGNASHTIHPIAGQGFNLGVRDVQQMAQLITTHLASQKSQEIETGQDKVNDIGSFSLLSEYAQQRKTDHQQIIMLTDSLVTLFSNSLPPLVVGRNIGLKVLNYFSPFKNALVNKTLGY
ncbi:MAG: 2-octaprenyl-6-methoxyphenyl hydroxylase [Alteromonadaceae bacterium]|nr:2-octaprenyl-6-methoxyphenyl hydroxylase [Alteromonadaceae bacterium]